MARRADPSGRGRGALDLAAVYQVLLWLAWLLPGVAVYALLRRALGDPWLALPGALVALTLSAGCRSGVEEGLRWGLIAARLGWGVLPLLALGLLRWAEGAGRPPLASAVLVAAVILLHPGPRARRRGAGGAGRPPFGADAGRRLGAAALILAAGLGLAAIWLLPLLAHLRMALPLAWADATLLALGRRLAVAAGAAGAGPAEPRRVALARAAPARRRRERAVAARPGAGHGSW